MPTRKLLIAIRLISIFACIFIATLSCAQIADETAADSLNLQAKTSTKTSKTSTVHVAQRSSADVFAEYQEKLESLARKCDNRDMTLEAKVTRSYTFRQKPFYFSVSILGSKPLEEKLPNDASSEQQSWYAALKKLRIQYADESFAIAERLGAKKKGYDVVACVLQTLYINPDHTRARKFFGYTLYNDEWRSPWEIRKLEKGYVDDPVYGWLPEEHVPEYHNGKRFYHNQWISREEEERKILASSSGWKIDTEHFSILSRVSLERGVEIGRFLESYYQAWSSLFYPFIANENQWTARLSASNAVVAKRHQVILYRNRMEYVRELRKYDKHADQSVGGYFPDLHCIFVYEPNPNDVDDCFELLPLLAHEATHQLFNECNLPNSSRSKSGYANLASKANFWAAEGIAITAETFKINQAGNFAEIGGYRNVFRIQDAMETLFVDESYIPLKSFAGMSRKSFQAYNDLNLLYSEAAGLAFFLMFYNDGAYCNAFVRYLYSIYQGSDAENTLELLTGKSFEELDKEYKSFMEGLYVKDGKVSKHKLPTSNQAPIKSNK